MAKYCKCENFYNIDNFKRGARVKFRELPIADMRELNLVLDEEFKISKVLFKVNQLGDLMVVVELDKLPGKYFSPSILQVLKIDTEKEEKIDKRVIRELVNKINELTIDNSYLRSTLMNGLLGKFN